MSPRIWTLIDPCIAPKTGKILIHEALSALKTSLPVCGIVIVTIGNIYAEGFTAMEGGSSACITLLLRSLLCTLPYDLYS